MRKNILIISIICLLTITISYTYSAFKNTIKGTITATTNNWKFSASVPSGIKENDYYKVLINNNSGSFDINLDTSGSNENAMYSIEFSGIDNINLYTDSAYSNKINNNRYEGTINKNETSTLTIYYNSSSTINGYLYIKTKGIVKPIKLYEYISTLENNGVDTNIDFSSESSETNGDGINIVSGTENDDYPVYYYRGNVENNNIIYANFCWLIVRTTETGGVKLIYNGTPSSGKCNNTGDAVALPNSVPFNSYSSITSSGYMYGKIRTYDIVDDEFLMFNDYYDHVVDYSIIDSSNTETETIGNKTFNIAGRHVQNSYSSDIKIAIDTWYQNNILDTIYEEMLEDTVWCNDRSYSDNEWDNVDNLQFSYSFYYRNLPTLKCKRDVDKFTVSSANGNGDLIYPIGLLTGDEAIYSGGERYYEHQYLNEIDFFTMTPKSYSTAPVHMAFIYKKGSTAFCFAPDSYLIRPALSLSNSVLYSSGDGTSNNPIQVKGN